MSVGHAREFDCRDFTQSELLSGHQSPVTGDDSVLAVDQNRIRKAELFNRRSDTGHLLVGVCPSVSGVRDEIDYLTIDDFQSGRFFHDVLCEGLGEAGRFVNE